MLWALKQFNYYLFLKVTLYHIIGFTWSEWGVWHGCSCYGLDYRSRGCQNNNTSLPCYDTHLERKEYSVLNSGCWEWNSWGAFGGCYNGVQAKSRTCKLSSTANPPCSNQIESRLCKFNKSMG